MDNTAGALSCPADYTSEMLQLYADRLEKRTKPELLDLGPVCEENIMYFARRAKRHHVCDIFIRMDRHGRQRTGLKKIWDYLDYPEQSFNGIHVWDLLDHLDNSQAGRLLDVCHFILKPRGLLLLTGFEESAQSSVIYSFVALDSYRLTFRPQHHLNLPLFYRSNRELMALLSKFRPVKSFLYRNGVREFFFQRD
jgi:hypothetical protein